MRHLAALLAVGFALSAFAVSRVRADDPGVFNGVMAAPCDVRWHVVTSNLPAGSRLVLHLGPETTLYEDLPSVASVITTGERVEWLDLPPDFVRACESDGRFRGRSLVVAYDARGYHIAEDSGDVFLVSTKQRESGPRLAVSPDSGRCDQQLSATATGLVAGRDYVLMVRPAVIGPGSGGATSGTAEGRAGPDGRLTLTINAPQSGVGAGIPLSAFRSSCESTAGALDARTLLWLSVSKPELVQDAGGLPSAVLFTRTESSLTPWPPPNPPADAQATPPRDPVLGQIRLDRTPNPQIARAPASTRPDLSHDGGRTPARVALLFAFVATSAAGVLVIARRTH